MKLLIGIIVVCIVAFIIFAILHDHYRMKEKEK